MVYLSARGSTQLPAGKCDNISFAAITVVQAVPVVKRHIRQNVQDAGSNHHIGARANTNHGKPNFKLL